MPRLAMIARYPVKGLGGEELTAAAISRGGLPFDRVLGLATGAITIEPFGQWTTYDAFATLIARADLALLRATTTSADDITVTVTGIDIGDEGGQRVHVPVVDGHPDVAAASGDLAALVTPVAPPGRLISAGTSLWDVPDAPISIINLATVREVAAAAGAHLDPHRFRANLYIEDLPAWAELDWVGHRVVIGGLELEPFTPIERCRATNADPRSGTWDVNVPGTLGSRFGHLHCGLYARVVRPGTVHIGDDVQALGVLTRRPDTAAGAPRYADVTAVDEVADGIWSLEVADPAGLLGTAAAGQHLRVHRADGTPDWRSYTISRSRPETVRVTARSHPDGRFSPWLTKRRPGDRVIVSGPHGVPAGSGSGARPLLSVTAGVGITPALAAIDDAVHGHQDRPLSLVHVARTMADIPHWDEVLSAAAGRSDIHADLFLTTTIAGDRLPAGAKAGRPPAAWLAEMFRGCPEADVLICGPAGFTRDMRDIALDNGIPAAAVHTDVFFSPRGIDVHPREAPADGPFTVLWSGTATSTTWTRGSGSLLDLGESQGLVLPAGCRTGACGTCSARVTGDTATLLDPAVDLAPGHVLLCSTVPVGDIAIDPPQAAGDS